MILSGIDLITLASLAVLFFNLVLAAMLLLKYSELTQNTSRASARIINSAVKKANKIVMNADFYTHSMHKEMERVQADSINLVASETRLVVDNLRHMGMDSVNNLLLESKRTLTDLAEDKKKHIEWFRDQLEKERKEAMQKVAKSIEDYEEAERKQINDLVKKEVIGKAKTIFPDFVSEEDQLDLIIKSLDNAKNELR